MWATSQETGMHNLEHHERLVPPVSQAPALDKPSTNTDDPPLMMHNKFLDLVGLLSNEVGYHSTAEHVKSAGYDGLKAVLTILCNCFNVFPPSRMTADGLLGGEAKQVIVNSTDHECNELQEFMLILRCNSFL